MGTLSLELPANFYLENDPDVLTLRRRGDDSMVAAFSALGVTPGAVRQAAEEACRREERRAPATDFVHLQARFFGRFELLRDGEEVGPLSRGGKAVSVLKYLLAHGSRPVSQDYLMGWLWPESDLKRARWSLNSTVYSLRKLLSVGAPSPDPVVLFEEGCYRLCPRVRVSSDVGEFDAHYERGSRLEGAGRKVEAAAEYEEAVALYRGDFLAEDLYEDWTMIERERLTNTYVDALDRLADHHAENGRLRDAIQMCHRILGKDPCHEHAHRRIMEYYIRLGLRGRALHQYRLCCTILEHTCEMEPSPETVSLYNRLLGGAAPENPPIPKIRVRF
jgi:DNA-binding SARP family transcriptional activator